MYKKLILIISLVLLLSISFASADFVNDVNLPITATYIIPADNTFTGMNVLTKQPYSGDINFTWNSLQSNIEYCYIFDSAGTSIVATGTLNNPTNECVFSSVTLSNNTYYNFAVGGNDPWTTSYGSSGLLPLTNGTYINYITGCENTGVGCVPSANHARSIDYITFIGEGPEPVAINDSTESTAVVKQVGSVSFSTSFTNIFSSTFNVTVNNTPIYGGYSFDIESTLTTTAYCELLIDGIATANITRTQQPGLEGNAFIQTEVFMADEGEHTQLLRCRKSSGSGLIAVSNAIGIGHFMINQDNEFIAYNSTSFDNVAVSSGSSFTLLDSFNITIGNYTEVDAAQNRTNHIVVESKIQYDNLFGSAELLTAYMSINNTNCSMYPRLVNSGSSGSVSMDCILFNVTSNNTYQVNIYGNGNNSEYTSNTIAKSFFLSSGEIVGGSGIITGYEFSGDTDQVVFNTTGGNLNHDFANAFTKLSYSVQTDIDTTVSFYIILTDGETFNTTTWSRDFVAGQTGVLIGHDILQGLPQDPNYNISLVANCGDAAATCTIMGGSSLGYLTDVITIGQVNNTFLMRAYNNTDNSTILVFNATDTNQTTYSTTNGNITIFSILSTNNYEVLAPGFFGRTITAHNTNNDLNVTMYPGIINITSPANNTFVNTMPDFSFIFENGAWKGLTCSYYDDRNGSFVAYDSRTNVGSLVNTTFNSVPTFPSSGDYNFYVGCENNLYQSDIYTIDFDITDPVITFYAPLATNNSFYSDNFTLNISITDVNNYDAIINITNPDGAVFFNRSYNTSGVLEYNITDLINLSVPGLHTLFIQAADGHTKKEISDFKKNNIPDGVKFNKEISIYGKNGDYIVTTDKKTDRYSMKFDKENEGFLETAIEEIKGKKHENKINPDPDTFIVEVENGEIDIIEDSRYKGHMVVRIGENREDWYWIDFENDQDAEVIIKKNKKNQVEVGVYGNGNYQFNSIGRLNVVNQTVEFYYDTSDISLVATYETDVLTGFETVYSLSATLNPAEYDLNETKTVTIEIDGDLYTNVLTNGSSGNTFFYYYPFIIPGDYGSTTLIHQWYFETIDNTNATVQTTTGPLNQNVFQIMIGNCNATLTHEVINFSYYDEKDNTPLSSDMNYDLTFFDGTYNYETEGFFNTSLSNQICTNIDPANVSYSWAVSGLVTLDAVSDNYTTRVYTFSPDSPLIASNTDPLEQPLYLIKLEDSQTVEYTWLSSNYELLDGVMRVYRCNNDNTRSLVESALITGGRSTSNIELLTSSYAYDVVVNGQVYTEESYNVCHIESSQDITYYVTLSPEQLTPVSGLLFTSCSLTGPDNDSVVTMTWDDNNYDDTSITACLQGLRSSTGNYVQVFEECSVIDSGSLSVIVPENGNQYTVRGYLEQGNNSAYCNDIIKVGDDQSSGDVLGMTGLFAVILLILAIALYYSDNSEMAIFGSIVALVLSWIIGLTAYGWIATISIVLYLLIILIISRSRKKK